MKKEFFLTTATVLACAGVVVGGIALNNKFAKNKITIQHGDAVWIGDNKNPVKDEDSITEPVQESLYNDYCEKNNLMFCNLITPGSLDFLPCTFCSDATGENILYYLLNSASAQANNYDKFFQGILVDGVLVNYDNYETVAESFKWEPKYKEIAVVLDQKPIVSFANIYGTVDNNSYGHDYSYFLVNDDGSLNCPYVTSEINGYHFAGWSTEYKNPNLIISLDTYRITERLPETPIFYPIYLNDNGEVYEITLFQVSIYLNSAQIESFDDLTGSFHITNGSYDYFTFLGIELAGYSYDINGDTGIYEELVITESCNIYAMYRNADGTIIPYSDVIQILVDNVDVATVCYANDADAVDYLNNLEFVLPNARIDTIETHNGETIEYGAITSTHLVPGGYYICNYVEIE